MKFDIDAAIFRDAFSAVSRVVTSKGGRSVMQSVLATLDDDTLTLVGTNGEQSISRTITAATVMETGKVLLPKATLENILRTVDDDALAFRLDGAKLTIRSGQAKWVIQTEDSGTFPKFDEPEDGVAWWNLSVVDFDKIVGRTGYAVDTKAGGNYALGAICLNLSTGQIEGVATDSRRLACQKVAATVESPDPIGETQILLPPATLKLVSASASGDMIRVTSNGNIAWFQSGNTLLSSRLTGGKFPNWRAFVLETDYQTSLQLKSLTKTVQQASVTRSSETNAISLRFESGLCKMSGQSSDVGESSIELAVPWDYKDLDFKIKSDYLLDMIDSLGVETVSFNVSDKKDVNGNLFPFTFKTDDGFFGFTMLLTESKK